MVKASAEGRLAFRADASQHEGDYGKIVAGINRTLDSITEPVSAASLVLAKISRGDLLARVQGNYLGEHARLKEDINKMVTDLQVNLQTIGQSAEMLACSSTQLTAVGIGRPGVSVVSERLDRIAGLVSAGFVKFAGIAINGALTPGKASPNVGSFNVTFKHRQRSRRTRRGMASGM